MTLKPEHIVEALNKKTFDEIDPDEVLKHYGYKPEEVRCNGVGIGVWRKEEAFQKLGDIGAWIAKREALFVGAFAVNEVVHSFRPFVIHPGGAVDRHSTDYKMKSILLFSPAGRVVSRCFVRFRAASFPDPGDNAHCRRRG